MEAVWTYEYRRETDRKKRKEILKNREAESPGSSDVEIRQKLWEKRYDKKNGYDIDYFIRGLVNLQSLKRRVYLPGEKKRLKKEIESIKKDWQFAECEAYGETGANALYDELYNMTLLYIEICQRDKVYNSVLWGIGHISKEKQEQKIIDEIHEIAETIPEKIEAGEELDPFKKAALDALGSIYTDSVDE
ncbi:MAG: hypothetical protein K6B28_11715 [Lachnospiraceae bacterium]|nr:hypothetical protein [Lachnospiraceae bacterium]